MQYFAYIGLLLMPLPLRLFLLTLAVWAAVTPAQARLTSGAPTVLNSEQVREDIQLAIDAVEAGLPDIYWHQTRQNWSAAKAAALARVGAESDAMGVYRILTPLMGQIGEGHLAILPPTAEIARQRETARVLPLSLHWSTEGVFIVAGYGQALDIPAGSRLLSINGEDQGVLLDELTSMTLNDGRIRTSAMRAGAGTRYAVLRHRRRGDEGGFALRYADADGAFFYRRVAPVPLRDLPSEPARTRETATLEWLAPGLAYLNVSTFSNRIYRQQNTTFRVEMQRIFEEVRRGRAKRLILDLRDNGGGSEPNESILFSYLVSQPLHKYASVEARREEIIVRSISGGVFAERPFSEDELNFQRRLPDGRFTRLNVPPEGLMSHWEPSEPVFTGRLVVLVGGYTFSGGAELASMLHHVQRGVFVGEEVGGAHEGNTSGYTWEVELPNSGIMLHVPLLQFRFNWPGLPHGRGVQPQCDVPPLVEEIGERRDRAWRVARSVAQQDWASPADALCPG